MEMETKRNHYIMNRYRTFEVLSLKVILGTYWTQSTTSSTILYFKVRSTIKKNMYLLFMSEWKSFYHWMWTKRASKPKKWTIAKCSHERNSNLWTTKSVYCVKSICVWSLHPGAKLFLHLDWIYISTE